MRWKLPDMVSDQMARPTRGTDTVAGTPNSARPLAIPANSEMVTAVFATSSAPIASALFRTPYFSRMSDAKPLPVTQPHRAAVSCTTMRSTAMSGSIHSVP